MNWDQIELKWAEMTRRVQAPSSLSSKIEVSLSQAKRDLAPVIDPAILPGLAASLIAGKPYE